MFTEMPSGLSHVLLRACNHGAHCVVSVLISLPGKVKEIHLADVPVIGTKVALTTYIKQVNEAPKGKAPKERPEEIQTLIWLKRESAIAVEAWKAYEEMGTEQSLVAKSMDDMANRSRLEELGIKVISS